MPTAFYNDDRSISERIKASLVGASSISIVSGFIGGCSALFPVEKIEGIPEQFLRDFRAKSMGTAIGASLGSLLLISFLWPRNR